MSKRLKGSVLATAAALALAATVARAETVFLCSMTARNSPSGYTEASFYVDGNLLKQMTGRYSPTPDSLYLVTMTILERTSASIAARWSNLQPSDDYQFRIDLKTGKASETTTASGHFQVESGRCNILLDREFNGELIDITDFP